MRELNIDFQGLATVMGATGVLLGVLVTSVSSMVNLIKTARVEAHVNSQATKFQEQITSLTRENDILRGVILDKGKVAELLAQAQSHTIAAAATRNARTTDNLPVLVEKVVDTVVDKVKGVEESKDKTIKVDKIETKSIVNKGK